MTIPPVPPGTITSPNASPIASPNATSGFDASTLDLDALNAEFEAHGDATRMIEWLVGAFPLDRVIVASAMTSDTVLVDVAAKVAPGIDVLFLDTGYHFAETLQTVDAVGAKYPIRLVVTPAPPIGDERFLSDPDECCHQRKVVPLEQGLAGRLGWISGVRRSDSEVRANTPFVQIDKRGMVKLNPIAAWTDADLATYAAIHEVPLNALLDQGYPSIGCIPCTRKPAEGEHARAGRWSAHAKTECGLHL